MNLLDNLNERQLGPLSRLPDQSALILAGAGQRQDARA